MSEAVSTPRVSARTIEKYSGRNVMLVGQVLQLRGDVATLEADGTVSVQLDRDAHLTPGNYAQLIGKVLEDSSLKVLTSRDLGADVGDTRALLTDGTDYQLVRAVVEATETHKRIFAFES